MLTKKGKYGLKALVELARREAGSSLLISEMAAANDIPKPFLETILGDLRQAGFVRSKKGRGGGYALARPPSEIQVGHVIRVLDGALAPIPCASRVFYKRCADCRDEHVCSVRLLMREVRQAVADILDHRSLADMAALIDPEAEPSLSLSEPDRPATSPHKGAPAA